MPREVDNSQADPGTPVIVDVTARTTADGSVGFDHEWRWQDGTPGGGKGGIVIPARGNKDPGTPIHFHLKDLTSPARGLDFTDEANGVMWVKRGESCPGENEQCQDPEIPADQMQRSPNLLKVVNLNNDPCRLHYRLRFKDRDGKSESYDPDITNGGTNRA
jgi:hypothetical protein